MVAEFATISEDGAGLTAFSGSTIARPKHSGINDDAIAGENWTDYNPEFINSPGADSPALLAVVPLGLPLREFITLADQRHGLGEPWFEKIIIIPRSFDFGLLLSTQQAVIDLYNADRYAAHDLTAFTNNIGTGVAITDLPSLPDTINSQRGLALTLEVTTDGPSIVDDTIDFEFDSGAVEIGVPIVFTTVILWGIEPEAGYTEVLEFRTDILTKKAGGEQRIAMRKNPRQLFELPYKIEEGPERSVFENLLFEHQSRIFGLPIWHEQTRLAAATAVNDTTINVVETAWADYRVGGLAVILTSQAVFDVLTIDSISASSLTFTGPVLNVHPAGTQVMPLRTAVTNGMLSGARFPVGLSTLRVPFRVRDNDVGAIASAAAFSTYGGKVLIEDDLGIQGTSAESFMQEMVILDPGIGDSYQDSAWDRGRRARPMVLLGRGKQRLWEIRQLFHHLKGPQVSFYLPTHMDDLAPVLPLSSGSADLDIANVGYTSTVQARAPKALIRASFNNGDPALVRVVSGSVVVDADRETLTLGDSWPSTYAVADVDRIEYVELVRIDDDSIQIEHESGFQFKRVTAPVKSVLA